MICVPPAGVTVSLRPQHANEAGTHLAGARLRQVRDDEDLLRRGERPDHLAHLQRELLREPALVVRVVLELPVCAARRVSRPAYEGCGMTGLTASG